MNARPLRKILCVEDEEDLRTILELTLGEVGGYEVKTCASGAEALRSALVFEPDLFLVDVMMPGMDGLATLRALRAEATTTRTPVIFLTARIQPNEVATYLEAGAIAVLAKPFDVTTLASQVLSIWNERCVDAPPKPTTN